MRIDLEPCRRKAGEGGGGAWVVGRSLGNSASTDDDKHLDV